MEDQKPSYLAFSPLQTDSAPSETANVPIYFLKAELWDYSTLKQENSSIELLVNIFWKDCLERALRLKSCEQAELEEDSFQAFVEKEVDLLAFLEDFLPRFEELRNQTKIPGMRVVLGHGNSWKEVRGEEVDFSGPFVLETLALDKPLQEWIEEKGENKLQMWGSHAFQLAWPVEETLNFENLYEIELNHVGVQPVFRVTLPNS